MVDDEVRLLLGVYHIRSRERKDIQNLVEKLSLLEAKILESNQTDYAVRIIVGKEDVLADALGAFGRKPQGK